MFGFRKMSKILVVSSMALATASLAASADTVLNAELQRVAQQKILFGHQSVGVNILEGMDRLAKQSGISLRIAKVKSVEEISGPMIAHTFIEENEFPFRKIESFQRQLDSRKASADIAFMKFCYVDFSKDTDVNALFEQYRKSMDQLKTKYPGTTFVHVTTPLHIVEGGPVARLKYVMGIDPLYGTIENLRRNEFNSLMRRTYHGREPVYDLAKIESTRPDGSIESVKWDGQAIPVMVPEYTSDGGHLNIKGEDLAARELVSVLANIPRRVKESAK